MAVSYTHLDVYKRQTLEEEEFVCEAPHKKVTVAVISSNVMGNGDDELGKILIKGFIYALSQMETHPDTILFYNGGAKLTTEDSESLEYLKKMGEEGGEILTCGTCLKHYGLMEKLMVGKVTDMYTICLLYTSCILCFQIPAYFYNLLSIYKNIFSDRHIPRYYCTILQ